MKDVTHLFVINPKSFPELSALVAVKDEITAAFAGGGSFVIHTSRYPRDAVGVVRKHAARHPEGLRVYAVGGDGILFDCLNGIIGFPQAELGAVPYGSTNDYARAISKGDYTGFKRIKPMLDAPSALTDVVHCGSNYFLNFCSIGMESAAIIKWYKLRQTPFLTGKRGLVNGLFTLCGVMTLFNKKLAGQRYTVTIDGQTYDGRYAVINISNGPCYGGDKSVVPDARFNDGLIDVLLVKRSGRLKLLTLLPGYLAGHYKKYPEDIVHVKAFQVLVRSEEPLYINFDGECFLDTNLNLRVMPSAVRMIGAAGAAYGEEE